MARGGAYPMLSTPRQGGNSPCAAAGKDSNALTARHGRVNKGPFEPPVEVRHRLRRTGGFEDLEAVQLKMMAGHRQVTRGTFSAPATPPLLRMAKRARLHWTGCSTISAIGETPAVCGYVPRRAVPGVGSLRHERERQTAGRGALVVGAHVDTVEKPSQSETGPYSALGGRNGGGRLRRDVWGGVGGYRNKSTTTGC